MYSQYPTRIAVELTSTNIDLAGDVKPWDPSFTTKRLRLLKANG